MRPLAPVSLAGRHVRLDPLTAAHAGALWDVARDPDLWRWTLARVRTEADLDAYVQAALAAQTAGTALPFVLVVDGAVAGSTRFMNAEPGHGRVEIGSTWVGRPWQRTAVNTESKRLLLGHAFEALGARRVELRTDALNARSRAAIARLGAVEEAVLRQHMVTADGRVRDTVVFSVLEGEWPSVRDRLDARLSGA